MNLNACLGAPALSLLRGATGPWLAGSVAGAECSGRVTTSLNLVNTRGFAAPGRPDLEQKATPQRTNLPPPWQPPPHNPTTLKPKPQPSLKQILESISQATTPLQLHNAYRRDPPRLPPTIAAAKYSRLISVLKSIRVSHITTATAGGPAASPATTASPGPNSAPDDDPRPADDPVYAGTTKLLREIRQSWGTLLQLYSPAELAACLRASCEAYDMVPRGFPRPPAPGPEGAPAAGPRCLDPQLVQRTLDVLLANNGQELAKAGPQAVLDVSYGLMVAGHRTEATWSTLGPLLRRAKAQLPAAGKAEAAGSGDAAGQGSLGEQVDEVLSWLAARGL